MNTESPARISGIILAGGKSRRMGQDKALLELDGKPILQHVLDRIAPLCAEVILVANDASAYTQFAVKIINDVLPGKGSLGGLYSGLLEARHDYAFAVACDMPFVNPALVRYLISLAPQNDVVIPRAHDPSSRAKRAPRADRPMAKENDLHPMHAIYSKRCLPIIAERLRADDLRLIGFLPDVRTRIVEQNEIDRFDPKHLSFFNTNTPDDFRFAQALAQEP